MKLLSASVHLGFASTVRAQAAMKCGITVPHHSGDMAEGMLRAILREAGISVDLFLDRSIKEFPRHGSFTTVKTRN